MKFLASTLLCFALLADNSNAGIAISVGSNIGPDSSLTDGNGVISSHINGVNPTYRYADNNGTAGHLLPLDGKTTPEKIRFIATVVQNEDPVQWSNQNWTVDLWSEQGFKSKAAPIITENLGSVPVNWSGFVSDGNGGDLPDTQPFGTPGDNTPPGTRSYELVFDLSNLPSMSTPLPEGNYVISITSRVNQRADGTPAVGLSTSSVGPEAYYSRTIGGALDPTKLSDLTSDFTGFAFDTFIRNDFVNGNFNEGLNNWKTEGPGTVEVIEVNGEKLARFTAGSPATLMQSLITESDPSFLSFDFTFFDESGTFDFFFGDDLLGSLSAMDFALGEKQTYEMFIETPSMMARLDDLSFTYNGLSGTEFYLDNVHLGIEPADSQSIPEPTSMIIFGSGLVGIGIAARRRKEKKKQEA